MVAFEASWSGPQQGRLQGRTAENGGVPVYSPGAPGRDRSQDKELGKGRRILDMVDKKVV